MSHAVEVTLNVKALLAWPVSASMLLFWWTTEVFDAYSTYGMKPTRLGDRRCRYSRLILGSSGMALHKYFGRLRKPFSDKSDMPTAEAVVSPYTL